MPPPGSSLKLTDILVLHCSGTVDHDTSEDLVNTIARYFRAGHLRIALDVKDVTHLSSAGVTALLTAMNDSVGAQLVLVGANPSVLTVLSLIGVTEIIPIVENLDGAMKYFQKMRPQRRGKAS